MTLVQRSYNAQVTAQLALPTTGMVALQLLDDVGMGRCDAMRVEFAAVPPRRFAFLVRRFAFLVSRFAFLFVAKY